jgi:ankyrin repeat protein
MKKNEEKKIAHFFYPKILQLFFTALYNDLDRLEKLCLKDHTNDPDNHGYTGLHYAARQGHMKACQILLKYGAHVNAQTHGGSTSLHRAALVGNLQICKLLIANEAKLDIVDGDGKTPLHRAAENQHLDVAKLLLDKNKNLKMMLDKKNKKPYDYIVQGDNQDDDYQCTELKALLG